MNHPYLTKLTDSICENLDKEFLVGTMSMLPTTDPERFNGVIEIAPEEQVKANILNTLLVFFSENK